MIRSTIGKLPCSKEGVGAFRSAQVRSSSKLRTFGSVSASCAIKKSSAPKNVGVFPTPVFARTRGRKRVRGVDRRNVPGIRAHAREKAAAVFQRTVDVAQLPQNGEIVVLKGVVDVDLRPDELRSARGSSRGMEGTACVFVSFPVCPLFAQPKPLFFVQSVFDVLQIHFD